MNSFFLSGARIDDAPLSRVLQTVQTRLHQKQFTHIITVNTMLLLELSADPALRNIFTENSLCLPESVGVSCLARFKKGRALHRLPGIDLMQALCEQAARRGEKIYLLGARLGVADLCAQKLQQRFSGLKIAGTQHGYFSKEEELAVLEKIQQSGAQYLFVALAMPEQEGWIHRNAGYFSGLCAMGVGGSFDVLCGNLSRAPVWMQRWGLEWFFRWMQEPARYKRMLRLPLIFFKR